MKKELIGCIADDFTGASDVCSFLIESGANCLIINDIQSKGKELNLQVDLDVIVVALKIRSAPIGEALSKVKQAVEWLEQMGATRIYDKYCSTFDSTEKGNIGPIIDYLIEYYDQQYTLVSPALPTNKREVFNGYLFADGLLLSESSMKNHPITPMNDSFIPRLLEKQSKYKCYTLNHEMLTRSKEEIIQYVNDLSDDKHFYIAPDYINDTHGERLIEVFGNLKLLSGSSSLINDWYNYLMPKRNELQSSKFSISRSPTLLLSGSLSQQTKIQISNFINSGGQSFQITKDSIQKENRNKFYEILNNLEEDILIYSSRSEDFDNNNHTHASEIEAFFSDIAKYAISMGVKKVIAAGGETSGAVLSQLNFNSFIVDKNIAPGVPILRPVDDKDIQIVLKSGNFGNSDFFNKAIKLMGE